MVPNNYAGYFQAASQAAGALVGLLFVVVALRPGEIVGPRADTVSKGLAASSFTGLVNAFFVSMLALIPGKNLGVGAAILAVLSLWHTLQLHLGRAGTLRPNMRRSVVRHIVIFAASLLAYGLELYLAIAFISRPHDADLVNDLSFVLIGLFAVALSRAWQLMQSIAGAADDAHAADADT